MRYLVTGATGFIGAEVVRQLAAAGHEVVALVRDPTRVKAAASRDEPAAAAQGTPRPRVTSPKGRLCGHP